jgi:MFS family permease
MRRNGVKMKQKIERNISVDYIFHFLSNFSFTDAVWVLYLTYKGLPLWQIGLLEGIFHVTGFLSELPTGAIADLMGRKKIIIISRVSTIISSVLIISASNFWLFALGFIFSAWGYNLLSGSEEALIYDSFIYINKEKKYYKFQSRLAIIIEIAQGLSTFIGGVLAEQSFYWCYIGAIIVAVVSLIPSFIFREPVMDNYKLQNSNKISLNEHFKISYKIIKESPQVLEILLFFSAVFTLYTIAFFYGQKYYLELGLSIIHISVIMFIAGFFSCMGALVSEKLAAKAENKIKIMATLVIAVGIIGMAVGNIIVSVIWFCIMSFANTVLYPLQSVSLNRLIPSQQRATIISVSSMTFSMFMLIIFPFVGFVADTIGLQSAFIIVGAVALIILFALRCHGRADLHRR